MNEEESLLRITEQFREDIRFIVGRAVDKEILERLTDLMVAVYKSGKRTCFELLEVQKYHFEKGNKNG